MHPEQIGGHVVTNGAFPMQLDLRIQTEEESVEVPSIHRLTRLSDEAREDDPAQSRSRREPRPSGSEHASERREPDADPFIERPSLGLGSNGDRRSHTRDEL